MKGGYYRYDFPKTRTTVLALNTMFYKYKNKCGKNAGLEQLNWLKKQLRSNRWKIFKRKFILTMHVFPGQNNYKGKYQ